MGNSAFLYWGIRQKFLTILLSPLSFFCVAFNNVLLSNPQLSEQNTPALKPGMRVEGSRDSGGRATSVLCPGLHPQTRTHQAQPLVVFSNMLFS